MLSLTRRLIDPVLKSWSKPQEDIVRLAISEDGTIVYASSSFCDLSHMAALDAGKCHVSSVLKFIDQPNNDGFDSGIHQVQLNGHDQAFNFHFDWLVTPDNRRYLVGSEAKNVADALNDAALDKVREKIIQSEKRILTKTPEQTNEQKLEKRDAECLLELSSDLMVVIDGQGAVLNVNTPFLNALGYNVDEVSDMAFVDIFTDEDKPQVMQAIQKSALDFESRVFTKSGDVRYITWRYAKNKYVTYCLGRDVSDQKKQEEQFIRRERQLSEAESIGRMGHWHWTIGQDDIQWSAQIYSIFGVTPEDFRPTLHGMNDMVNRRDMDRVNQAFQRAIIEQNDYDMEFCINRPDGELRFIRCEGRCGVDENDEVIALYGIMQDMTERISYERDLKAAKESAERAYAAKSQFLANMSHELRTPLNAIIGFSDMMGHQLFGPLGDEKYIEYVQGIQDSGHHLLDLISDILDMSKIEAGKYELDLEEVSIAKVIKMAGHMVEGRAREEGVQLSIPEDLDENLKIVADRRAVMQIILNLVSNAVKFTEDGGHVDIECYPRDNYVALKIIDDGIGIPANKLAQITQPFEQASSDYTREYQGSGLGLAITKELIDLHGGAMLIDSEVGMGTTVTVRLPYRAII